MATTLLFLLAALVLMVFILIKIIDPSSEAKQKRQDFIQSFDPQKEWNAGAFLLKVGPFFAGLGLVGYLVREYYDVPLARLILISSLFLIAIGAGLSLQAFAQKNKGGNSQLFAEVLLIIASFLTGGVLLSINDFYKETNGEFLISLSGILGFWFLVQLPLAYAVRSIWIMAVNMIIGMIWFAIYLNSSFNFIGAFGIELETSFEPIVFLALPTISSIALTLLYAWHQTNNHNEASSKFRPFFYMTGFLAFLNVGAVIFEGINKYNDIFISSGRLQDVGGFFGDLILAAVALSIFAVDFVAKKTIKDYNINYLAPIMFFVAAVGGSLLAGEPSFVGYYFLEIPFILWLLADYLRNNSQLAQMLFYTFNSIQLFAIATGPAESGWFKLLVLLGIIMYAAIIHFEKRLLVYYIMVAGILSLVMKVFAFGITGLDPFLLIAVAGLILMGFGFFYTQTRSKIIDNRKDNNPFNG